MEKMEKKINREDLNVIFLKQTISLHLKYNIEVTFTLSIFFTLRVNMTLLSFNGKRMV